MKTKNKVIALSIFLGLFAGLLDSVVDFTVFYEKPFWNLMIFEVPALEIYFRGIILALFTIFGLIVARIMVMREQVEEKVHQQSEFLNSVLESLTHPFYVIDASDFRIKLANAAAYRDRRLANSTCYALARNRDLPCGSADHPCPLEIIKKTKQPVMVEHTHFDKNRNPKHLEVHGYPIFDADGHVSQVIEYSLDATKRKRAEEALQVSEEKFRGISSSANDAIITMDSRGNINYWNEAAEKIFGYSSKEITGMSVHRLLVAKKNVDAFIKEFESLTATGKDAAIGKTLELSANKKDGTEFPIELSLSSYQAQGEKHSIGIIRDISDRKFAEEEREKIISDLQEALAKVKTLSGMLPICASCKKIRDDKGYWNQIEAYIHKHSDAEFSHGICPECAKKLYPDLVDHDDQ